MGQGTHLIAAAKTMSETFINCSTKDKTRQRKGAGRNETMIDEATDATQAQERRTLAEVSAEMDALDMQIDELNRRKSQLTLEHDEIAEAASPVPLFF